MLMKLGLRSIFCFFVKTRKQMIFPEQNIIIIGKPSLHLCLLFVQENNGHILSNKISTYVQRCNGKKCEEFDWRMMIKTILGQGTFLRTCCYAVVSHSPTQPNPTQGNPSIKRFGQKCVRSSFLSFARSQFLDKIDAFRALDSFWVGCAFPSQSYG